MLMVEVSLKSFSQRKWSHLISYCIHSQKLKPFVSFSILYSLARQAFDVNYGLFMVTDDQLLYPNSSKYARESEYHLLRSVLKGILLMK